DASRNGPNPRDVSGGVAADVRRSGTRKRQDGVMDIWAAQERLAPTVSVVIPAFNAADYIAAAIESALAQTYPAEEVIVVDDGSTDDTAAIAMRFSHPVRVLQKPNGGPASARNTGISAASGTWIALLDA